MEAKQRCANSAQYRIDRRNTSSKKEYIMETSINTGYSKDEAAERSYNDLGADPKIDRR